MVSKSFIFSFFSFSSDKFIIQTNLVFLIFLLKLIQRGACLLLWRFLNAKPISESFPHEEWLLWRLFRRERETSLHDDEHIALFLVELDEVFATIGVVPLSLHLVTFTLIPPFFTFSLGMVLVGCVELEFFPEIFGSIDPAFGRCSSAGLGSEGYGIIVSKDAFAVFFGGLCLIIGFIIVFLFILVLIVMFGAPLHIKQLVIFILLLNLLLRCQFGHLCPSQLFLLGSHFGFGICSLLGAFPEMLVAFTEFPDVGVVGAESNAFPMLF